MKNIKNIRIGLCLGLFLTLLMPGCSDLDYENTGVINPTNVWRDKNMINGYLTDIHGSMMPGWGFGQSSDETVLGNGGQFPNYYRGILDVEEQGQNIGTYGNVDKINYFLEQIEGVPESVLTDVEKKQFTGQALFWRAWDYWGKVQSVGGVPLILKPQDVTNVESLFVSRNKTSECVAQIIKDLDDAISFLPDTWEGANYGRIDKGTAMAFKGKILMWYASPLFNPSNDASRWQTAYDANKAAVTFLRGVGKDLLPSYGDIWKTERHKEVIMVNQFYYPDHAYSCAGIRPQPVTQGAADDCQPYLPLLLAYPKKDGSKLNLDVNQLSNPAYNEAYLTDFYTNRDDRFYASVFCGGTKYPSPDIANPYWCTWVWNNGANQYTCMGLYQLQHGAGFGVTGFYSLKANDPSLAINAVGQAGIDWIEIRFAEVLMNFGECANEVGQAAEALQVLYDIRERAGILAGNNGQYGITASAKNDIREVYVNERLVEFAFEGKRWGDLRRWKRFDILNNLGHRPMVLTVLKPSEIVPGQSLTETFDWTKSIMDADVRKKFNAVYIENLDGEAQYKFNLDLNHWFYPIRRQDLEGNSNLLQNNEWGGTFDPLL